MNKRSRGVTLLELIIAIVLISVVILALASIQVFSRFHVLNAERRAVLQNEVTYIIEHMTKNVGRASGNELANGANSVVRCFLTLDYFAFVRAFTDAEHNSGGYLFLEVDDPISGGLAHTLSYCSTSANNATFFHCDSAWETLGTHIAEFVPVKPFDPADPQQRLNQNYIEVSITACWDPAHPDTCGTQDNPQVSMRTRIQMPMVSAR